MLASVCGSAALDDMMRSESAAQRMKEAMLEIAKSHGSHGEFTHGGREECVDYIIAEMSAVTIDGEGEK